YRLQGRSGKGIIDIKTGGRNGLVVGLVQVRAGDDILLGTTKGELIPFAAEGVSSQGRHTGGGPGIAGRAGGPGGTLGVRGREGWGRGGRASGATVLDPRLLREQPEVVEAGIRARGAIAPLVEYRETDARRRRLAQELDELRARRNRASETVAQAKRRGADAAEAIEESRRGGGGLRAREAEDRAAGLEPAELALRFPNLPHPSVPIGASADDNVEVRRWGEPRTFAFEPRPHWELGELLGILDFERGARLAKSRFTVLWGLGARLERALSQL